MPILFLSTCLCLIGSWYDEFDSFVKVGLISLTHVFCLFVGMVSLTLLLGLVFYIRVGMVKFESFVFLGLFLV